VQANETAECAIRKAIASKPEDASLHYILSTILKQQEKTDEAIAECKRAIEMGFQEAAAYVNLGNLYYEKMDIAKSIETLESAVQKDPEAAEDIAGFALSVLTASDSIQLREILEKYAADHPENINTLYSLGVLYLNQNQFVKSKEHFLKVEKLAPKNSQVYYNLGLIYTREGNDAEASKAMARFEELKAHEREEWLKMNQAFRIRQEAEAAIQKGDHNKAIGLYSKLEQQGVAEKEDLFALGQLQIKTKEVQNAASTFEKTLQKWPYEVKAIKGRLETATQLKNSEEMKLYSNQLELLYSLCK
jgi:tetratricopeptide (TPR) repeat protein